MNNVKPMTTVKPPVLQWDSPAEEVTYAKVCLSGASGSGKTRTAIELAKAFVPDESKIGVLNTEGASGAKVYKRLYPNLKIMTINKPYLPKTFIDAINMAIGSGMQALIIDSATHEWEGVLTMVNNSTVANDLAKWKVPDNLHKEFLALIKSAPIHIFATIRTKTKHIPVKGPDGKPSVMKRPGALIQREGADYEFDLGLTMMDAGTALIDKSHYDTIQVGQSFERKPDEIAKLVKDFLYPEAK